MFFVVCPFLVGHEACCGTRSQERSVPEFDLAFMLPIPPGECATRIQHPGGNLLDQARHGLGDMGVWKQAEQL